MYGLKSDRSRANSRSSFDDFPFQMRNVLQILTLWLLLGSLSSSRVLQAQEATAVIDSLYRAAEISFEMEDYSAALANYSRIIALDSLDTNAHWNRANLFTMLGDFDQAADGFRVVTELAPTSASGHGDLGWTLILLDRYEEAYQATRRARALDPDDYSWALQLGHLHLLTDQPDSARVSYEAALGLMQSEEDVAYALADMALYIDLAPSVEAFDGERTWMQEAFQQIYQPRLKTDNLLAEGDSLLEDGRYVEAASRFEEAAAVEQESTAPRLESLRFAYGWAGFAMDQAGQYEQALMRYHRALELAEQTDEPAAVAEYLFLIGEVYAHQRRYEEALNYQERALAMSEQLGRDDLIASRLNSLGLIYHAQRRYDDALLYLERARVLYDALDQTEYVARLLNNIGLVYKDQDAYERAIQYFGRALEIAERIDHQADAATYLSNLGIVDRERGRYSEAIQYFERALTIEKQLGRSASRATGFTNLGQVYIQQGRYDEAVRLFEQALEIAKEQGQDADRAASLSSIGTVYSEWGRYEQALDFFERALDIYEHLGAQDHVASVLQNIAVVFEAWKRYDEALTYYARALEIARRLKLEAEVASGLNNIGGAYQALNRYDEALRHFEQALEIDKRLGREASVATVSSNIGNLYFSWGRYDEALTHFERALEIADRLQQEPKAATYLSNLGGTYWWLEDYEKAIGFLERAIVIMERLRETATGEIRRDYLAKEIYSYYFLILSHFKRGDLEATLQTINLSQARLLADRLGREDSADPSPLLHTIQQALDENTALLVFANTVTPWTLALVVTKEEIYGAEIASMDFFAATIDDHRAAFQRMIENQRMAEARIENDPMDLTEQTSALEYVIYLYRQYLATPSAQPSRGVVAADSLTGDPGGQLHDLSRRFYDLLIAPLEEHLTGKKKLIIIPDGPLAFLPFETLIDSTGTYLVENYDVGYAQSLTVWDQIRSRSHPPDRAPMLAFGGAVYDAGRYEAEMVAKASPQLEAMQRAAYAALDSGGDDLDHTYAGLGYGAWKNLPGTLAEVEALSALIPNAEVLTGAEVSENVLKQRSEAGRLDDYRVLHFATHGLVVPELPELSALVLSQGDDAQQEDGYLRMAEIAELDLAADFVNLSACETGLGKLYGGEGVVGLAQAFMQAGANSLSVSLWQVADRSTSQFMQELYRLVEEDGLSYRAAMTEVKRGFLRGRYGEAYRAPYYWAPFVYYGR